MHTLTVTILYAPVQFESASREGAVARFVVWLQAIAPSEWHVRTALGFGRSSYLRVSGPLWVVNVWRGVDDPGQHATYADPHAALHAFGAILLADGDQWKAAPRAATAVTLIMPDPAIAAQMGEPDPEQVAGGVTWLWGWMREHRAQTLELRAAQQTLATVRFHLTRSQWSAARAALAALPLTPGGGDADALPEDVRAHLERVAGAVIRPDAEALRRCVHALLDGVGMGWDEAQIRTVLAADAA